MANAVSGYLLENNANSGGPFVTSRETEAMLAAAIWFLRAGLGIHRVYMHTYEMGWRMKDMWWGGKGPRSIYSRLPRRFCFRETRHAPWFLRCDKSRRIRRLLARPDACWHMLDL